MATCFSSTITDFLPFRKKSRISVCEDFSPRLIVSFLSPPPTARQVVDHSGSAEQGAELILAQLEKVIKQV